MNTRAYVTGALAVLAMSTTPAIAQTEQQMRAATNEFQLYVGELFGDDLTDDQISDRTPELDDDITWGLRYGYNFSEAWGLDVSGGWTATSATGLAGGDIDFDFYTLDIDAIWHMNPNSSFVGYLVFGGGYASGDLDVPITGIVDGQAEIIDDDDSWTANAGFGAKWIATDALIIRGDARYRYMDKLVDNLDDSLGTYEITVGIGWRF